MTTLRELSSSRTTGADAECRAASVDGATIADAIAILDEPLAGLSDLVEEQLGG